MLFCALSVSSLILPVPAKAQTTAPTAAAAQIPAQKLLAQMKVQQEPQGTNKNSWSYSILLSPNVTAELTVTIQPNQQYTPTPQEAAETGAGPRVFGLKATNDVTTNTSTLSYFVPYSSLTPDVVQQLQARAPGSASLDRPTGAPYVRLIAYTARRVQAASTSAGQEQAPTPLGNENQQGEEGVSITAVLQWAKAALEDLESLAEQLGLNAEESNLAEYLGTAGASVSSLINAIEALGLNQADTMLLNQIMAYLYCIDNSSNMGLPPSAVDQNAQQMAAVYVADARIAIEAQFDGLGIQQASPLTGIPLVPIVGPKFEEQLGQELQDADAELLAALAAIRGLVPQCQGMWYGTFNTTVTQAPIGLTVASSGILHFIDHYVPSPTGSVPSPEYTGIIAGQVTATTNTSFESCTGSSSFQATISGNQNGKPGYSGLPPHISFLYGPTTPATFPIQCTSAETGPSTGTTSAAPNWPLEINLDDTQPSSYALPYIPTGYTGAAAAAQAAVAANTGVIMQQIGETGNVVINIKKLQ